MWDNNKKLNVAIDLLKAKKIIKYNSEIAVALDISPSVVSEYANNKKEASKGFMLSFEKKYNLDFDKINFENKNKIQEDISKEENLSQNNAAAETLKDLARIGLILAEANNKLVNTNNRIIEDNISLGYIPSSGNSLITRSVRLIIAEFLGAKYSIPQNEIFAELGRLVLSHAMENPSKDIKNNDKNLDKSGKR